jgi:hypothetical protein
MNHHIENVFRSIEEKLPLDDLISSKSLIDAGIVKNSCTLARWRRLGYGPAFIKLSPGKILYIRSSVLEWLRNTGNQENKIMTKEELCSLK